MYVPLSSHSSQHFVVVVVFIMTILTKSLQMVTTAMKLKDSCFLKKSYDQPRQHIKKQRHYFVNKVPSIQGYGFSSGHVWMWESDCKESWALKNWYFWNVVLEKTLESPLNYKEIQPVHPKGNRPEYPLEGLMLKLKLQYFGHLMWRIDSFEKTNAEKDCRRKEKGTTEDEMVGWHQWLDGHEFEKVLGVGDGQGSLACCIPWSCKELDTTEWLN